MVNADGSVCADGQNDNGQLGDGTAVKQIITPEKLIDFSGAGYLSTGWHHALGLKTDGTLWAWGYNVHGELGDGTQTSKSRPTQAPGVTGAMVIAAGRDQILAAKNDGQ